MASTTFQLFWRDRSIPAGYRTGVSLHSHTCYSEEGLDCLPYYLASIPFLSDALGFNSAEKIDLTNAFYNPPLPPRKAYRVEEKQINRSFNIPALVSLTDHDDSRAGMLLRVMDRFRHAPISTEWTVPFGETFFHLGIHNLPSASAADLMTRMLRYTADPSERELADLLETLDSCPNTLLVFNHPLWDEKRIGSVQHAHALGRFFERHSRFIHAVELNGMRSWSENKQAISLGTQLGLPLVGGGDRHGLEPNSIINLSRASSFAEFANEIRRERSNHVVFMPQYKEPYGLRIWQLITDVMREYPEHSSGRRWLDRMFIRDSVKGVPVSFATAWGNANVPGLISFLSSIIQMLDARSVRWALRLAFRQQENPVVEGKQFA